MAFEPGSGHHLAAIIRRPSFGGHHLVAIIWWWRERERGEDVFPMGFDHQRFMILLFVVAFVLVLIVAPARRGGDGARTCRTCGAAHPRFARFCRRCGRRL